MHAMRSGAIPTAVVLLVLFVCGGMELAISGPARAGNLILTNSIGRNHGRDHHTPVKALLTVAGTDLSAHTRGSGIIWETLKVGTSFSASTVRDLYLYIYWTNLSGNHIVTVTFYSPDGQLYEQRLIPVTTSAQSVSPRMVPGVERSVNVQSTRNFAQYNVSTVQLPVAGTWITRHRLLGTWRADVLLDQASTPIVSSTFTIMN